MKDDISDEIKTKRLQEIIDLQREISLEINQASIGSEEIVLVEGFSKKSNKFYSGRTDTNKVVIVPFDEMYKEGDYVKVRINKATSATLFADIIELVNPSDEKLSLTA